MKKRALFRAGLIWRIFCINSKQEIKRVHKKEIIIIKKIKAIVYKKYIYQNIIIKINIYLII